MFTIHVELEGFTRAGLQALDFRRAQGLRDHTKVAVSTIHDTRKTQVDEGFARCWFAPDSTDDSVTIDVTMLARGELIDVEANADADNTDPLPEWSPGLIGPAILTPERIKELYVAARFRAARPEAEAEAEAEDEGSDD